MSILAGLLTRDQGRYLLDLGLKPSQALRMPGSTLVGGGVGIIIVVLCGKHKAVFSGARLVVEAVEITWCAKNPSKKITGMANEKHEHTQANSMRPLGGVDHGSEGAEVITSVGWDMPLEGQR